MAPSRIRMRSRAASSRRSKTGERRGLVVVMGASLGQGSAASEIAASGPDRK
jgi:hypothetical protein